MTGRKENKQKGTRSGLIRKISALAIAILLVITGTQVDWKSLVPDANAAFTNNGQVIYPGTEIGQISTGSSYRKITDVSFQVFAVSGANITANITGLYRDSKYLPNDGNPIATASAINVTEVSVEDATDSLWGIEGKLHTFKADLRNQDRDNGNKDIVLAAYEGFGVTANINLTGDATCILYTDNSNYDGFITQGGYFGSTERTMEVGIAEAAPTELPSIRVNTNIDNGLVLAPGNTFDISVVTGGSYMRQPQFSWSGDSITLSSSVSPSGEVNPYSSKITAIKNGDSSIKINGDGIAETTVPVSTITASFNPTSYVYSGKPIDPTIELEPSSGTGATVADFEVKEENRGIDVGTHYVTITGKQPPTTLYDVSHYFGNATYEITAKNIDDIKTDVESSLKIFVDTATNQLTNAYFDWNDNRYNLGTDFYATVQKTDGPGTPDPVTKEVTYKYKVEITGIKNFTGTTTIDNVEYKETYAARAISDVYDIRINNPEITWGGGTTPPANPSLTIYNKLTGATTPVVSYGAIDGKGLGLTAVLTTDAKPGINTITVSAAANSGLDGTVNLDYVIKQDISTADITLNPKTYICPPNTSATNPFRPTPEVVAKVKDSSDIDVQLTAGTDFDVIYPEITGPTKDATVTIVGKGFYTGQTRGTFKVYPELNSDHTKISIGGMGPDSTWGTFENGFKTSYTTPFTGSAPVIEKDWIDLRIDDEPVKDFTIEAIDGINAGFYAGNIRIKTGVDYGEQTLTAYFTITKKPISGVRIDVKNTPDASANYSVARKYIGEEIKLHEKSGYGTDFEIQAMDGTTPISIATENYTFTYENNIDVGDAIVKVVMGPNSNYTSDGSAFATFRILPCNINDPMVSVDPMGEYSFLDEGQGVTPDVTVRFNGNELEKDSDYKVIYDNNTKITSTGNLAKAIISGTGNFTGDRIEYFSIVPKAITNDGITIELGGPGGWKGTVVNGVVVMSSTHIENYNGGPKSPVPVVKDNGKTLKPGVDYTFFSRNNINAASVNDPAAPFVRITGIGNYGKEGQGTIDVKYTINKRNIDNATVTTNSANRTIDPIKDTGNIRPGNTLKENTDYTMEILDSQGNIWNGSDAGKITIKLTGIGNYFGTKEEVVSWGYDISKSTIGGNLNLVAYYPLDKQRGLVTGSSMTYVYYMGNTYPKFYIVSGAAWETAPIYSEDALNVEYTAKTGDGYSAGSVVEATITGKGGEFFGTRKVTYSVGKTRMDWPTSNKYAFSGDYEITVNGKPVKAVSSDGITAVSPSALNNKTGGYFYAEFDYTGETNITPEVSATLKTERPGGQDRVFDDFPATIPVDNIKVNGVLNLNVDTSKTKEPNVSNLPGKIDIAPSGTSNFQGTRTIYYRVIPTQIVDPTDPTKPAADVTVTGIEASYPYMAAEYGLDYFKDKIEVKVGDKVLVYGTDYTLKIGGAAVPGTDNKTVANGGAVVISGNGYYGGDIVKTFDITPLRLTDAVIDKTKYIYDSGDPIPTIGAVSCTNPNLTLVQNTDYKITGPTETGPLGPMTYTVDADASGMSGNYTGKITKAYTIFADISKPDFTVVDLDTTVGGPAYDMKVDGSTTGRTNSKSFDDIIITHGTLSPNRADGDYKVDSPKFPTLNGEVVITGNEARYYTGKRTESVKVYGDISQANVVMAKRDHEYPTTADIVKQNSGISVTYAGKQLELGRDYEIDNTDIQINDVGTVSTLKIKGKSPGPFAGTDKTENFNVKYDLSKVDIELGGAPFKYNYGAEVKPTLTVTAAKGTSRQKVLQIGPNLDCDVVYSGNTEAGLATVTLASTDRSFGTNSKSYTIDPVGAKDGVVYRVEFDTDPNREYVYTGNPIVPASDIKVYYDPDGAGSEPEKELDKKYYTVSGSKNINVTNNAELKITFTGSFSGSKTEIFKITPKDINDVDIIMEDVDYTGKQVVPKYTIKDNVTGNTLRKDVDYTLTVPADATEVGTVTVTFTGKGNYDSATNRPESFAILPLNLEEKGTLVLGQSSFVYSGNAVEVVSLGAVVTVKTATGSEDVTAELDSAISGPLSGSKAINVGEYTITFTPKASGNFEPGSSISTTFEITKKSLPNKKFVAGEGYETNIPLTAEGLVDRGANDINMDIPADYETNEAAEQHIKEDLISLRDAGAGKELYKVTSPDPKEVNATYINANKAGVATLRLEAVEDGNYSGYVDFEFRIGEDISGAVVDISPKEKVYNGSHQVPDTITVTFGGNTLDPDKDYVVGLPSNAVNADTYPITIQGIGKLYGGEKKIEDGYKITPKPATGFVTRTTLPNNTMTYTGSPAEPPVVVYDPDSGNPPAPIDPSQYRVVYSDNTGVGEGKYKIYFDTPTTNYSGGPLEGYFWIDAVEADEGDVKISFEPGYQYSRYNGAEQKPKVTVTYNGNTLTENKDYDLSYEDNILPGEGMVLVELKDNYVGYATETFPIIADIGSTYVTVDAVERRFTGSAINAKGVYVVLAKGTANETLLVEGTDYIISRGPDPVGGNWTRATKATVTVEAASGSNYTGRKTVTFDIVKDLAPGFDPEDEEPPYKPPYKPPVDTSLDVLDFRTGTITNTEVNLSWTSNPNATSYNISWVGGGNTGASGTLPRSATTFTATGLAPNTTYTFNITASANGKTGNVSSAVATTSGGGPTPGDDLYIPAFNAHGISGDSIQCDWAAPSGSVTGYSISWVGANGVTGSAEVTGTTQSYIVTGLSPNTYYTFTINAKNGTTVGPDKTSTANTTSGGGGGSGPGTVTGVTAKSNNGNTVTLSWTPRSDITGYRVYRSTTPGSQGQMIASLPINHGSFIDAVGLVRGTTYYYSIVPYIRVNSQNTYGTASTPVSVILR